METVEAEEINKKPSSNRKDRSGNMKSSLLKDTFREIKKIV